MVSIGKVHFSAKCLFGCMSGLNFFSETIKWIPDSIFFTFCMPKNDLFFPILGPPLFSGRRPDFFQDFVILFELNKNICTGPPSGLGPPVAGGVKKNLPVATGGKMGENGENGGKWGSHLGKNGEK